MGLLHPFVTVELAGERDGDAARVDFVAMNTSATETAELLSWNLPIDGAIGNDVFRVTTEDGARVPYLGLLSRRLAPTRSDYIFLGPGERWSGWLDLGATYAIAGVGTVDVVYDAIHQTLARPVRVPQLLSKPLRLPR